MIREVNGWAEDELDPLGQLEDDESFGLLVDLVRAERIHAGLNPDTGRPFRLDDLMPPANSEGVG